MRTLHATVQPGWSRLFALSVDFIWERTGTERSMSLSGREGHSMRFRRASHGSVSPRAFVVRRDVSTSAQSA